MGSENVRYFGMSWVKMSCACNQRVLRRVVCLSQACRMPQSCAVLIGPGVIVNRIIFFYFRHFRFELTVNEDNMVSMEDLLTVLVLRSKKGLKVNVTLRDQNHNSSTVCSERANIKCWLDIQDEPFFLFFFQNRLKLQAESSKVKNVQTLASFFKTQESRNQRCTIKKMRIHKFELQCNQTITVTYLFLQNTRCECV